MKRFFCWLRFGHIWYEVGPMKNRAGNNAIMVQCRHCCLTLVVGLLNGDVS